STAPADVFGSVTNLLSVWYDNPNNTTVEFIQNPDVMVPKQDRKLTWFPDNPIISNLYAIHGGAAYLVHIGGTASTELVVTGEPVSAKINWQANSFNFVGFSLVKGQEPLFRDFFSADAALAEQEIYTLVNDEWVAVTNPSQTMEQGKGFWIYCAGSSSFQGPVTVQLDQGTGLHYGTALVEQNVQLHNNSEADAVITLSLSETLELYYAEFDPDTSTTQWQPFSVAPAKLTLNVAAGASQKLRIGVRRAGLTAGQEYSANISITDNSGSLITLPVSVTGISHTGLWVGSAVISKVNQPADPVDPTTPRPAGSNFTFRLIVHVDNTGQARLLKEVIQLWQEGGWIPDPDEQGKKVADPDNPGHYVLLADNSRISQYSGAALRDGRPVGRRISSPAFGNFYAETARPAADFGDWTKFTRVSSKELSGAFQPDGILAATLWLPMDDPTNPFIHAFHPGHSAPVRIDDPENPGQDIWSQGQEKRFDIIRTIRLQFSDQDEDGNLISLFSGLNWGSSEAGGIYRESIDGLRRERLEISGTFLLRRVSSAELVQ
ncbi:MAG: hypothetical protein WBM35_03905, partial [Candidatus Electrothrix sp.]